MIGGGRGALVLRPEEQDGESAPPAPHFEVFLGADSAGAALALAALAALRTAVPGGRLPVANVLFSPWFGSRLGAVAGGPGQAAFAEFDVCADPSSATAKQEEEGEDYFRQLPGLASTTTTHVLFCLNH